MHSSRPHVNQNEFLFNVTPDPCVEAASTTESSNLGFSQRTGIRHNIKYRDLSNFHSDGPKQDTSIKALMESDSARFVSRMTCNDSCLGIGHLEGYDGDMVEGMGNAFGLGNVEEPINTHQEAGGLAGTKYALEVLEVVDRAHVAVRNGSFCGLSSTNENGPHTLLAVNTHRLRASALDQGGLDALGDADRTHVAGPLTVMSSAKEDGPHLRVSGMDQWMTVAVEALEGAAWPNVAGRSGIGGGLSVDNEDVGPAGGIIVVQQEGPNLSGVIQLESNHIEVVPET
ncbi:protein numb isoform X1 [Sesbania bispinosa]|nr:protein numb isoform X1 [Sesbania bispinosa]